MHIRLKKLSSVLLFSNFSHFTYYFSPPFHLGVRLNNDSVCGTVLFSSKKNKLLSCLREIARRRYSITQNSLIRRTFFKTTLSNHCVT